MKEKKKRTTKTTPTTVNQLLPANFSESYVYIYFYVTSFNRILNAADGQTQTQPRPILHWSVYVHFICTSHYFRKLLSPPCHPFPSKMFREDTTETSHWRAGLWETLSYTMQVNWSYASLRQTSPPTPV